MHTPKQIELKKTKQSRLKQEVVIRHAQKEIITVNDNSSISQ